MEQKNRGRDFFIALREIDGSTIEKFMEHLDKPNNKYYNYIVNGKINHFNQRIYSQVSINYLFDGLNSAIQTMDWYKHNYLRIIDAMLKTLLDTSLTDVIQQAEKERWVENEIERSEKYE